MSLWGVGDLSANDSAMNLGSTGWLSPPHAPPKQLSFSTYA